MSAMSRLIESLLFQPSRDRVLDPRRLGRPVQDVELETEDGVRLHAYFLPAGPAGAGSAAAASREAGRALLFLHGNAGEASSRLPNAAALADLGADVLLLDYRGYGQSAGAPSERGVYADARAGLAWLVRERGHPQRRVVVFGRSLGGAVAVDLARGRALAGLVLESTFSSIADLARSIVGLPLPRVLANPFPSDRKIVALRAPVLFLHGDRDRVVPIRYGRALFEAAPQPKRFEVISGAGHDDTVLVGGAPYLERIRRFLDEVAPL
jgi:uncharacterized protein